MMELQKISEDKGESIAEVMVALLISAVALVMLASMIATSQRLIESSRDNFNNYYTDENKLAELSGAAESSGSVSLGMGKLTNSENEDIGINYYIVNIGSEKVIAYKKNS